MGDAIFNRINKFGEYNSLHPQNTKTNVVVYSAGDFESPAE